MKPKLLLIFSMLPFFLFAQDMPKEKIDKMITELQTFIKQERTNLKHNIQATDSILSRKLITEAQAIDTKKSLADETSKKIEAKVSSTLNGVNDQIKKIVEASIANTDNNINKDTIKEKWFSITIKRDNSKKRKKTPKASYKRMVFAVGLNNVIANYNIESLDNSPYNIWGSNFVELGWGYRSAFDKNNPVVGIDYGLNILWKELKLFDNQYHVNENGVTTIETHTESLKKSKLRTTQLIAPIFIDVDFSQRPCTDENDKTYRSNGFKFGLGGYVGLRLNTKQIIKFNRPRESKKVKIRNDYNMNNINYGLAAYIGYYNYSLYAKYDLHPLFNNTDISNVGIGIRCDF